MIPACKVAGFGFRAFAKNIWGLLANGVGANGFNHCYDYKVGFLLLHVMLLYVVLKGS